MNKVIFNGNLVVKSEATVSIADKGYFFGFSVYSSIKVVQGKVFFPDYHVDRLFESAEVIDLNHNFTKDQVMTWLNLLIKENNLSNALLRMVLIGDVDANENAKLFIFSVGGLTFYPNKLYKNGAKVITYIGERRFPKAKTTDLLLSFVAFREAKKANALDALLIDMHGNIREGTRTNFYAIKANELIVPPAEKVLEGVTKKIVLDIAKDDFVIKEQDISLKDIATYDEFFITSTSMNVMPIRLIDNYEVQNNFEKTKIIIKLFKNFYEETILR